MSEQTAKDQPKPAGMIPRELLALVKKPPAKAGGEPVVIKSGDVHNWRADDHEVVVVTKEGRRYRADLPAPK